MRITSSLAVLVISLTSAQVVLAQTNVTIYSDSLVNGWSDVSYGCTRNFATPAPVHSGSDSIRITMTNAYGGLALSCSNLIDTTSFSSVSFWLHGGTVGGQQLQMYGTLNYSAQSASVPLAAPVANTWQEYTVPLSALGVANTNDFTGFAIQNSSGSTESSFYVDDIQLNALTAPPTNASAGATEPYGLDAMAQFERLPYLKVDTMEAGQSSFDRTGGNGDASNFLYVDGTNKVLLDLNGPGTIYRMWFTGFDTNVDYIQIYFDGEATPRINMLLNNLFIGTNAPFLSPLVGNEVVSSGGYYCYLPLPFKKSIKIESNATASNFYYNLGYHVYTLDTSNITTWTGTEDSSTVLNLWKNAGLDPKPDTGNTVVSNTFNLAAGTTQTLLDVAGPSSISVVKLSIPGTQKSSANTLDILTNVWLSVSFDNETNPSVYAPIGSFFAMGQFGPYPTRGLPVGMDASNNMYCYFPMPFPSRAVVQLISQRSVATTNIHYEIRYKAFTDSFTNVGCFKTYFNNETPTANDGQDILMLDKEGAGHVVGVVMSFLGPADGSFLEGDERIYVDDNESPAIYGTGTEDFFNGGWYFDYGLFTLPTHGYTAHVAKSNSDEVAAYRFFMQDAIPFRKHIRVGMEHGTGDSVSENVWTLVYYYYQPIVSAVLTDQLDVGNSASETAHAYSIGTPIWSGSRTYQYDGNYDSSNITDDGRAQKGYSVFTMNLNPTNAGAILRRRFDQSVANQTANVFVDGALVGAWYQAGSEIFHDWRDGDFMIPASFTSGKSSTQITIQFVSSSDDWNEFTYSLYSVLPRNQTLRANAQTVSGYVNHDLAITLSGLDPDGNPLSYWISSLPAAGTLYQYSGGVRGSVINAANTMVSDADGRVIFAPTLNGVGNPYATFDFTANNGFSGSTPVQVMMNINLPQVPQWTNCFWTPGTNGSELFALNFGGSSNATYSVWSSTNLTQWQLIGTSVELTPGQYEYFDMNATNWPEQFYRISAP